MMESQSESNKPLLTVACRFVPYDRWLITHLDDSWTIKQVKLWILSKCNLVDAPDLPRYRAVSPIRFAKPNNSKSSINGDESDDEGGLESGTSGDEGWYQNSKRSRNLADSWPSYPPLRKSKSHSAIGTTTPSATPPAQYTILTFSNAHVLDDDYLLSWYNLRPYELLEVHPAGTIIRLPRDVMVHYVRPYFEARIQALRIVSKEDKKSHRHGAADRDGAGSSKSGKLAKGRLVSSEPVAHAKAWNSKEPKNKSKTTLIWRSRWVVIHQGVLSLCTDRSDLHPSHRILLTSIVALRGAEHVAKHSPSLLTPGHRIVCVKYRVSSAAPSDITPRLHKADKGSQNEASTSSPNRSHDPASFHPPPVASSSHSAAPFSPSHLFTNSAPPDLPQVRHKSPSRAHINRTPASNIVHNLGNNSPMDNPSDNASKMRHGGMDVETQRHNQPNAMGKVIPSSSVSGPDDQSGMADRKRRDNGKGKEREVEEVKETVTKEAEGDHEWIIMDLCDDNAFTSIIRILHRHCRRPMNSSFLPQSSTLISNMAHSPPSPTTPLSLSSPHAAVVSPFTNAIISPFDSSGPYPMTLGTMPYPEWRTDVANRAQKAGLGHLGKGLEQILCGTDRDIRGESSSVENRGLVERASGRGRRDTIMSTTSNRTVVASEAVQAEGGDSDQDTDDQEPSDCEWEGWMRDLGRQGLVEAGRQGSHS